MRIASMGILALAVASGVSAYADLQDVEVGGSLRIRGNWYSNATFTPFVSSLASGPALRGAPLTSSADFNGNEDTAQDIFFIEQRTKVNVRAELTNDVSAFIELDSYNLWGDSFRGLDQASSGYFVLDGVDNDLETPVAFYQGFVELRDAWGYPVTLRIGRQELQFGNEWLVGNNDTASLFRGLSFDGVLARYDNDRFNVSAFWTRLVQNNDPFRFEEAGDVDFMGVYATYTGIEDMTIDGYWLYYRDPSNGLGQTKTAQIHTVGARFAGAYNQFDWSVEGAYQVGDTGFAAPLDDVNAFAVTGEAGYTFDAWKQPRVMVRGAYFSGDDEDAAFNRLFSDTEYSLFLDATDLSNVWLVGVGWAISWTEKLSAVWTGTYYQAVEDFGNPDSGLGFEVGPSLTYQYSDDVYIEGGYRHFFAADGVKSGLLVKGSGTILVGGLGDSEDQNYVYLETGITF